MVLHIADMFLFTVLLHYRGYSRIVLMRHTWK